MGEERNVYKVLVEKPEGQIPLGKPRLTWEDGIRIDLRRLDWGYSGFSWLRIETGGGFY
jgi:hypothetical protein